MQNNSHLGETKEHRLNRFINGPPAEVITTLLSSIKSFFNNEIAATLDDPENPQTSLMFLGIHSVALTIAHGLFGETRPYNCYKLFLEHFIDGETLDTKFSTIAEEIHEWRNVLAHRWLNVAGHQISYDFVMPEGWKKEGDVIIINPKIYLSRYLAVFGSNGRIWDYRNILTTEGLMDEAKERFISKYEQPAIAPIKN